MLLVMYRHGGQVRYRTVAGAEQARQRNLPGITVPPLAVLNPGRDGGIEEVGLMDGGGEHRRPATATW
jgi:hypothetical protein